MKSVTAMLAAASSRVLLRVAPGSAKYAWCADGMSIILHGAKGRVKLLAFVESIMHAIDLGRRANCMTSVHLALS